MLDEQGLKPTARDPYLQMLNEYYIGKLLNNEMSVLDIGCGEGSSTIVFAKLVRSIVGVDYSDTLIKQADYKAVENSKFMIGDVLELDKLFSPSTFDAVISIRCLINIPDTEQQYRGLDNIVSVLKPGGLLLLSEGYQKGWKGINKHRKNNGLSKMEVVPYNKLFGCELKNTLMKYGKIVDFIGFGEYLYGSRVVHPLLFSHVKHDAPINKVYADLHKNSTSTHNFKDCDYVGIYVVKKNG